MNDNLKEILRPIIGLALCLILAYVWVRLLSIVDCTNNILFTLMGIPVGLLIGKFSYWLSHKVIIK